MNPFETGYYHDEELRSFGFKAIGNNVKIAKNCTIAGLSNISIGSNVIIDSFCSIIATGIDGKLELGSYVHIGGFCHILANGGVEINDFSGLSQGVKIYSKNDDYSGDSLTNSTIPEKYKNMKKGSVAIKEHVIIGANSIILPNVIIDTGVSIGALSLVTTNLESWNIYFGNPLRKLGKRSDGLLLKKKEFLKELHDKT
jgi:acetyltransferase-like isoleucine patch superfamily enzyme